MEEKRAFKIQFGRKGERIHASGSLMLNDCTFTFSLNEQSHGKYLMRGRVGLRSQSGKILRKTGVNRSRVLEKMRKANNGVLPDHFEESESLLAIRQVNTHTMEEEEIRAAVFEAAERLYAENYMAIQDDARLSGTDKMHPSNAVRLYKNRFFASYPRRITKETRRGKELALEKIASKLDRYTMDGISMRALQKLYQELGKRADELFRLAEAFWNFCKESGVYRGENPFEAYFLKNPATKRGVPEELIKKALKPQSLPVSVERTLNQEIEQADADDVRYIGMLLAKDAGFPAGESCQLLWTDLLFNQMERPETTVQFRIQKENIAGATHDYTRPGTLFCARELLRHANAGLEHWGTLEGHYVLESFDGKRLTSKELTEFCRERLLHSGMDYTCLTSDRTQPYGVGIRLLLAHYKYRITCLCGLQEDSGAVQFLLGHSLSGNVTADYYRSFTSPEGQDYLLNVLNRDKSMEKALPVAEEIQAVSDGNMMTVTVGAADPNRFNHVTGSVLLEKGQYLDVRSMNLLHGHFKIRRPKEWTADQEEPTE